MIRQIIGGGSVCTSDVAGRFGYYARGRIHTVYFQKFTFLTCSCVYSQSFPQRFMLLTWHLFDENSDLARKKWESKTALVRYMSNYFINNEGPFIFN